MLLLLLIAHCVCDFPLQGQFLSDAKNHKTSVFKDHGIPPWYILLVHSFIHAGAVYLITGSLVLGSLELYLHFMLDYTRCEGKVTFMQDQAIHIGAKVLWAFLFYIHSISPADFWFF
jgi:hypothetical protein